jgi:hypothetical protein
MRSTHIELTQPPAPLELSVPDLRPHLIPRAAMPWVLLVLAVTIGGFAAYTFWGRALTARAAAERATGELALTRQRAFEVEKRAGAASTQLAALKAENDRLRGVEPGRKTDAAAAPALALAESSVDADDKALYRGASAQLNTAGKKLLRRAASGHAERMLWVVGSNDARALVVVHYLVDELKVDPRRVAYRPAARSARARP